MLTIILPTVGVFFMGCIFWFAASAKRNVPITVNDAEILWKIHKKSTKCAGHKCRFVTHRGGKISGFECECGYRYTQKRPLVSTVPNVSG